MTNPINYETQKFPAYSGITINITNPTVNPPNSGHICSPHCQIHNPEYNINPQQTYNRLNNPTQQGVTAPQEQVSVVQSQATEQVNNTTGTVSQTNSQQGNVASPQEGMPQAYPPQYYLNNYNYIQNGEKGNNQAMVKPNTTPATQENNQSTNTQNAPQEEDLSSSKEIISKLDAQAVAQKELEKNGKQKRITALTNEYIMSLENYLNNPNNEIRLMASKEVLTRLDEDKSRYDDAALNALLNKMLQDPNKLVRIAALSAFASQLASGNDYTVELLKQIQNNPNADKEDVVQAADILLKMSSSTEIRYVPVKQNSKSSSNKELEASQKQVEQLRNQLQQYKEKEIAQMLNIPQGK